MKPARYTILIIPDHEGNKKQFSVSLNSFYAGIFVFILIFGALVISNIYMIPRVLDYNNLHKNYKEMVQERTKVLELYQDLERLKQLKVMMQRSLGADFGFDQDQFEADSLKGEPAFRISYTENIPSVMPVKGFITQTMIRKSGSLLKNHYGIDIAAREGEAIVAAAGGQVIFSGWTPDLGNLIVIYHGNDYITYYGHNQLNLVDSHQYVKRGEVIANIGNTGMSSGPHLHFEIWKEGEPLDPLFLFPEYYKTNVSLENG